MPVLRDINGVLFDAGGVLVMPDPKVIGRLLQTLSLDASDAACHRLHYVRVNLYDELAPAEWATVDYHLARRLGLRGEIAERAAHLLSSTFGNHRSVVVPGVPQVLRELHNTGKTLGVSRTPMGRWQLGWLRTVCAPKTEAPPRAWRS